MLCVAGARHRLGLGRQPRLDGAQSWIYFGNECAWLLLLITKQTVTYSTAYLTHSLTSYGKGGAEEEALRRVDDGTLNVEAGW